MRFALSDSMAPRRVLSSNEQYFQKTNLTTLHLENANNFFSYLNYVLEAIEDFGLGWNNECFASLVLHSLPVF